MATPKRRIRSPYPGVVLIPPEDGHPNWRARFADPDTGRMVKLTIAELTTAEARRAWAIRKSKTLGKRRLDLEAGAPRATGTALGDALDRYFDDHKRLRAGTVSLYRRAAGKLGAWCAKAGVRSADDLTAPHLVAFCATLADEPLNAPTKGAKRGKRQAAKETRAPVTVNSELRAIGTVLGYVRRLGLLPKLGADGLADALKKLKTDQERLDFRKPAEIRKLLEAALRHDAETFDATRDEHAGKRPPGTTPRYKPIAPFVAAAILTGMREGELRALDWKDVDLEALDHDGRPVGEIYISAASKTHKARAVGLEVSPGLRALLAAMKLRSGGKGSVFGLSKGEARAAERRLRKDYGAPEGCGWQALRRTCETFLVNAPGLFGAASAYRAAKQLGHSVEVAEKHYVGVVRGIQRDARTLEAAMQLEDELSRVTSSVTSSVASRARSVA